MTLLIYCRLGTAHHNILGTVGNAHPTCAHALRGLRINQQSACVGMPGLHSLRTGRHPNRLPGIAKVYVEKFLCDVECHMKAHATKRKPR